MTICDYCGEDFKIVFTCKSCRGKFCKDHKKPQQHNCHSLNKTGDITSKDLTDIPDSPSSVIQEKNNLELRDVDKIIPSSIHFHNELADLNFDLLPENSSLKLDEPENIDELNLINITPLESLFSSNSYILTDSIHQQGCDDSDESPENTIRSISDKQLDIGSHEKTFHSQINSTNTDSLDQTYSNKGNYQEESIGKNKRGWSFFNIKLLITTLMLVSIALNGVLYTEYQAYQELSTNYVDIYNNSMILQSYYETLTSQYSELRQEYNQMGDLYKELLTDHNRLEDEYYSVMSYQMKMSLEDGRNITIGPKENYSMVYQIPFSGVLDVSYASTGEAYAWIGSNKLDGYYSRVPQFPETATELDFTVPVYPDLIIYFANPNEFETITLTYKLDFTY